MALFSEDLVYTPPSYGAQDMSKEEFKGMLKSYHSVLDEIVYTPEVWLPGTDDNGNLEVPALGVFPMEVVAYSR